MANLNEMIENYNTKVEEGERMKEEIENTILNNNLKSELVAKNILPLVIYLNDGEVSAEGEKTKIEIESLDKTKLDGTSKKIINKLIDTINTVGYFRGISFNSEFVEDILKIKVTENNFVVNLLEKKDCNNGYVKAFKLVPKKLFSDNKDKLLKIFNEYAEEINEYIFITDGDCLL